MRQLGGGETAGGVEKLSETGCQMLEQQHGLILVSAGSMQPYSCGT